MPVCNFSMMPLVRKSHPPFTLLPQVDDVETLAESKLADAGSTRGRCLFVSLILISRDVSPLSRGRKHFQTSSTCLQFLEWFSYFPNGSDQFDVALPGMTISYRLLDWYPRQRHHRQTRVYCTERIQRFHSQYFSSAARFDSLSSSAPWKSRLGGPVSCSLLIGSLPLVSLATSPRMFMV